nr:reverse transcriptase domain-containing protein [Tanacetum cinerariifolium]
MPPKRTSTSAAPSMTQAAIRQLVANMFSRSNCTEDCKVKFATGTLTEEALSWWNYFVQPIGIEEAYKITWVEFKNLLIQKYCPQTEVQKMEDEFYHLTMKGNDLKTYVRRFQELAILCPTMVSDSEKMMEAFIEGLPRRIPPMKTTITTTTTMITTNNRIEGRKPSGPMLLPQLKTVGMLDPILCMPPKKTSTSAALAMTQAAIWQLVADSVAAALEAQATNMTNTDNTNMNLEPRETLATRKYTYKDKYIEDCKVQKIEEEFYHLTVKGNDLKTYVKRFKELEALCPTMVSDYEKMMEAFIGGLPQSTEGNVTVPKPQIQKESINIA